VRRIRARLAASAELRQVEVRDTDRAELGRERLRTEMGVPSRARLRTNIREGLDVQRAERLHKLLERPRAVTDGPDIHELSVEGQRMRGTYHSMA